MGMTKKAGWILVVALTFVSIASKLLFNGLILGLDYGVYQPDGSHYAFRTLTFMGVDANAAAERVSNFYLSSGYKNNYIRPNSIMPINVETWGLVAPRVLYPILSIPFVYAMGIPGMLVVPIISYTLLVFSIYKLSRFLQKEIAGLALVFLITTSPTVLRWMLSNVTDSLLTGLFSLVVLVLSSVSKQRYWYASMASLVILTSLTRFCLLIWVGISLTLWLQKARSKAIWIFSISSLFAIPTFILMPATALLPGHSNTGGIDRFVELVKSFFQIGFIEVAQLAALDRILLLPLATSFLLSFRYLNKNSSRFFISCLLAVWLTGAINGSLGVNFRYQLPLIGFMAWVIIENSSEFSNWFARRRINIVRKET